jgi:Ca2+-binding RTX toxin-like protein
MATTGTSNNDTLVGSIGNDTLIGYGGNDTYRYALGSGLDTVRDTSGTDTLLLSDPGNLYAGLNIYRSGNNLVLDAFSAGKLTIENQFGTTAPTSRIESMTTDDGWGPFTIQNGLTGSSGADLIVGTSAAESISGGLGSALMWGGAGNDTINGGGDDNEIHGGAGNDSLIGGGNDDEFYGGAGSDNLSGGTGYDEAYYADLTAGVVVNLSGLTQAYNNRLIGADKVLETGANTVDTMVSIEGINGTDYADYFMLGRTSSNTDIYLGKGNDTVDGGVSGFANSWATLSYGDDPSGVIVNLSRSYLTVALNGTTYNVGRGTAKDGWGNKDTFILGGDNLSIIGSEHADYFRGRDDTDDDNIWEWFGGGRGNDTIDGGTGSSDTAGYGVDDEAPYGVIVNLSSASITVSGLAVNAGTAQDNWRNTDTLRNIENINGSRFADYVVGSSGNNGYLSGEAGNDTIKGGGGMDNLFGGAGNDSLMGDAGQDHLTGGVGKDALSGGADRDYFNFSALNESGTTSTTWDVITDFTRNASMTIGDVINISMIDANAMLANDQSFNFIGGNAFNSTNATGQLRYAYSSTNGYGVLYASTDADTTPEFALRLNGVAALSTADFIL